MPSSTMPSVLPEQEIAIIDDNFGDKDGKSKIRERCRGTRCFGNEDGKAAMLKIAAVCEWAAYVGGREVYLDTSFYQELSHSGSESRSLW